MKHCFLFLSLTIPLLSFSQYFGDNRSGISLGATNYIMDTNFISSKSSIGFSLGLTAGIRISDAFEVLTEINYNYHRVKLLGREQELDEPTEINYNLQNFSVPVVLHYNFLELNEFYLGAFAGPTATMLYGYATNESNEDYKIDPLGIESQYMNFDSWNESVSINAFLTLGISVQYESFMASLRYNKGITDPYRNVPVFSPFMELKGKDNYWAFVFTYFFN